MRVLLDECLPRRLKRELVGHDARTAPEMGWASKRNGELLALAAGQWACSDFVDIFREADTVSTMSDQEPGRARRSFTDDLKASAIRLVLDEG